MWFLLIITVTVLYIANKYFTKKMPQLDGPKGYPILGDVKMMTKPFEYHTNITLENCKKWPRLFQASNPLFSAYWISNPDLLKEVMVSRSNDFMNHPTLQRENETMLTTKSLISIKDKEWKERRYLLSQYFTTPKITLMIPTFIKHTESMINKISNSTDKIDMRPILSCLTLDVLGDTVFGSQFDTQNDPNGKLAKTVCLWMDSASSIQILSFLPYWDRMPFSGVVNFKKSQDALLSVIKQVFEHRRKTGERENDLLQALIDADLVEKKLLAEALLFLIAGHETTATTLTWAVYSIAQNPEIEKRLLQEIDEVLQGQPPNEENLHKLKYTECVINETLRKFPAAIATTRENTEEVTLDGVTFPAKTPFFVPIWAIHNNEKYWEEPNKFNPERFEKDPQLKNSSVFMPFGLGPRMCLGYRFSLMESKIALAMLYQKFTFSYDGPMPKVLGGLLYRPANLNVNVHIRK